MTLLANPTGKSNAVPDLVDGGHPLLALSNSAAKSYY